MTYRRWIGVMIIVLVGWLQSPMKAWSALESCAGPPADRDPLSLYGDEMLFSVLREGKPIGSHRVSFGREGESLVVDSRFEAEVKVMFITAFEYLYRSRSVWRDGCMVKLQATTDDNGERSRVTARLADGRLMIDGPSGETHGLPGLFPTDHWHAGVLGSDQVLNTITGRVASVDILDMGEAAIRAEDGRIVSARHYVYSGDLHTEVWYDASGRWVKMRFRAEDGSRIEYVCRKCGLEIADRPS